MPLFVCTRCNTIDNTALAPSYWSAATTNATAARWPAVERQPILCTTCETGTWHGRFPVRQHDLERDGPIGAGRQLLSPAINA